VTVRAGKVESVNVVLPNGRLNINATPWAEVTIDGRACGRDAARQRRPADWPPRD
jgi:hypothetical protein